MSSQAGQAHRTDCCSQGELAQARSKLSLPLQQWGECQQTAALEGQRPHWELSLNPLIKSFSDAKAAGSEASLGQPQCSFPLGLHHLSWSPFSFLSPRHTIGQYFDLYYHSKMLVSRSRTFPLNFTYFLSLVLHTAPDSARAYSPAFAFCSSFLPTSSVGRW